MVKIVSIVGARPQFIKAATIYRVINKWNQSSSAKEKIVEVIVHTGQHYDENMSGIFFDELQIPKPHYNLGIGSESHGRQTGQMLAGIEEVLSEESPDFVLTYGDTNSTLAGTLAAVKLQIPSGHVEAGLRSFNRKMPEEINRMVADRVSNLLFCPTRTAINNLLSEGFTPEDNAQIKNFDINSQMIFQVGDVMYDSILFHEQLAKRSSTILATLGLEPKKYCLVTIHRAENTDDSQNLQNIFDALKMINSAGKTIVFPLHPRTKKCLINFGLDKVYGLSEPLNVSPEIKKSLKSSILFIEPVGYLDMIQLEKHAQVIFTDSGGVQKEAYFLKVPCITLRNETEWVETVEDGWNVLVGADTDKIITALSRLTTVKVNDLPDSLLGESEDLDVHSICEPESQPNQSMPYGDGKAAERIIEILWGIHRIPSYNRHH